MNAIYQVAGVSKQAFHQQKQREAHQTILLEELESQVQTLRKEHPGCGLEKMYRSLQPDWLGRDRFVDIFRDLGYGVRKRKNFQKTTIPTHIRYPNLISGMLVMHENIVWQTDITYYYCVSENRFYYLVFIIGIYTKVIKGFGVNNHMRAEANIAALKMAFRSVKEPLNHLVHHSDRGGQYIDQQYQQLLRDREIQISMGICAQDNSYAERINGTIKNEYLQYWKIDNLLQLRRRVKQAVNHYNSQRIHNHLPGNRTPLQFEKEMINLTDQERPKVIVYAEGNYKIHQASSQVDFRPRQEPQVHVCPIVIN